MSRLRFIALVALVVAGLGLLVIGSMDDRSINWVNIVLAAACSPEQVTFALGPQGEPLRSASLAEASS